ncbi:MAG: M23 family metallopeptidase [Candidatus Aminicenantales bacterium]
MNTRIIAALLLLAVPVGLSAVTRESLRTPSGVLVEMACRSFQPGEPVLFILKSRDVLAARLCFMGKTVVLKPDASGGEPLAFFGIDLDVKPGPYPLDILAEKRDGTLENLHRDVIVSGKTFPSQKIWVAQEFVTPTRPAVERIGREAEIVGLVYASSDPEWLGDGGFMAPHPAKPWPNFGQRRLTNNVLSSVHGGVDLQVPWGEPIRAANRGRVVLASPLYLSGNSVIIDHGLGTFSFYGHLSTLLVHRGDMVDKGAVIGKCGSTGRSTGPHLHWSMRVGDSRVDPFAMLAFPLGRDRASGE